MRHRQLGTTGLEVSVLGLADARAPFINEQLLGETLAPVRDQVVVATKFGFVSAFETGERRELNSRPAGENPLARRAAEQRHAPHRHAPNPRIRNQASRHPQGTRRRLECERLIIAAGAPTAPSSQGAPWK